MTRMCGSAQEHRQVIAATNVDQVLITLKHELMVGTGLALVKESAEFKFLPGLVLYAFVGKTLGCMVDDVKQHHWSHSNWGWPMVMSHVQVTEGDGCILVIAVGPNSEWGKTMELVGDAGDENTPLQDKLEDVAAAIGKIGFGVAVACFIALLIK